MHRALLVCLLAASALARQPALLRAGDALVINEMPCTACTNLLTMLQSRLDDPTSQQQLMQYVLQDVCPQLPQETRTQCSIFAPLVIASAVGWVREQSPVTVCTRVGLCPDTVQDLLEMTVKEVYARAFMKTPVANATLEKVLMRVRSGAANDDCDTCKIAVLEMATILADPDTQKDILDYAQQACDTFPAFKDQCVAYVETYGPVALATAIAYLQPALCQNIGFCPAPLPPVLQQQQQMSLTS